MILEENIVPYDSYSLEQTAEGVRLFVNGPWNTEMESLVQNGRIHELVLNLVWPTAGTSLASAVGRHARTPRALSLRVDKDRRRGSQPAADAS